MRQKRMQEGCTSTSKVVQRLCHQQIAITKDNNKVDPMDSNRNMAVINKAVTLVVSSKVATTKAAINKMARMMNWRNWL
jgi:hypothetical protein